MRYLWAHAAAFMTLFATSAAIDVRQYVPFGYTHAESMPGVRYVDVIDKHAAFEVEQPFENNFDQFIKPLSADENRSRKEHCSDQCESKQSHI